MDPAADPPATPERRSPTPGAVRKREAIRCLKTGLDEDRFLLHYQPIVDARDSRIVGVEALLRWRAGETDRHPLEELIHSAERSPVIFKLENGTLREACLAAAAWRQAGLQGVRVHVNLSAREFPRADLVGRVRRQLDDAGLDPGALGLEVTETSSMEAYVTVAAHLDRLMEMGIELWLDDFGTGHSSLEWLSRLPLNGVKIAATFVQRALTEKRTEVIITRVIEMAHDLGLRVNAEGVETAEQRAFLAERGCDLLQGFLLYAAMPAEELPRLFAGASAPVRP
jgi:EAL domain-containing protein (putative c-di-GMP-specific phosphodiesterase class I)